MLIGHFCYGRKFGIITNGLGIPRHIDFFDDDFKSRHKDFIYEDTDSPDFDKSVSDSKSLKPIFTDFYNLHSSFHHDIFLGDAAFDTIANYDFLLRKNVNGISLFKKAFIPLNSRASSDKPDSPLNEHGIPVCPFNHSLPMVFNSHCHEKGRADRDKWICPKTSYSKTPNGSTRICNCENPCTDSKYGRVTYTYPSKNLRLYPGTIRNTDEWNTIYKIRGTVEQAINHIKSNMGSQVEKLEIAKLLNLMFFLLVLLNFLLLLLLIVCLSLNTSEVLKNLLVNIWFSMFKNFYHISFGNF